MTPDEKNHAEKLAAARRELEEASKRLERHTITEADLIRRNRAERIVRELEGTRRNDSKGGSQFCNAASQSSGTEN
jgi:hypothetical protein